MNPIEMLEKGISNSDWSSVCQAYNILTGKKIPQPNNNTITKSVLISAINNLFEKEQPKNQQNQQKKTKIKKTEPTHFVTNEEEVTEEMIAKNKELSKKRDRQTRPAPRKYNVKCSLCEKPFESYIASAEVGQQCPKCVKEGIKERKSE